MYQDLPDQQVPVKPKLQLLIILKSEFITLMDHLLLVVAILEGIHSDVSFKKIRILACSMSSVVV